MLSESETAFLKAPIGYQLKIVNLQYRAMVDALLKETDITMVQFSVLIYLISQGRSATQKELCEALHVKHPTMNGLLARMEEKALITQSFNPDNRRQRMISVTDKAKTILDRHKEMHDRADRMLYHNFSEEEKQTFAGLLYKIHLNLTESGKLAGAEMPPLPCSNMISPEEQNA